MSDFKDLNLLYLLGRIQCRNARSKKHWEGGYVSSTQP